MSQWNWQPSVLIGVAALMGTYAYAIWQINNKRRDGGRERQGQRPVHLDRQGISLGRILKQITNWRSALFMAGSLTLLLALISPLDTLGDEFLFSAHMVQHMLLALVVPLFWLIGLPTTLVDQLLQSSIVRNGLRALGHPVAALLIFNFDLWIWHWPALYEFALADEKVHIVQHLTFIAAGFLNWWPIFTPSRTLPKIAAPLRLVYLAAGSQLMSLLGVFLVFARAPIYRTYVEAPRIFDVTPLTDQQIGGLIMWIPGDIFYLVLISIIFLRWMEGEEDQEPSSFSKRA